jgi:hypothetical protein
MKTPMTVADVIRLRERIREEVFSMKCEDLKIALDLIKLLKAGRRIISPAPKHSWDLEGDD